MVKKHDKESRRRYVVSKAKKVAARTAAAASFANDMDDNLTSHHTQGNSPLSGPSYAPPSSSQREAASHCTRRPIRRNRVGRRHRDQRTIHVVNNYYYSASSSGVQTLVDFTQDRSMGIPPPPIVVVAPIPPARVPIPVRPMSIPPLMSLHCNKKDKFDLAKRNRERLQLWKDKPVVSRPPPGNESDQVEQIPIVPSKSTISPVIGVVKSTLVLWGSSHLKQREKKGIHEEILSGLTEFRQIYNESSGGGKLTQTMANLILARIGTDNSPDRVFVFLLGGNNLRDAKNVWNEIGRVEDRFTVILSLIRKIGARVIVCGLIPDPLRADLDAPFQEMDAVLSRLDLGPLGKYLELRPCVTKPNGQLNMESYRRGDIHLSPIGVVSVGSRIREALVLMTRIPLGSSSTTSPVVALTAPALIRKPGPASRGLLKKVVSATATCAPTLSPKDKEAERAKIWAMTRRDPLSPITTPQIKPKQHTAHTPTHSHSTHDLINLSDEALETMKAEAIRNVSTAVVLVIRTETESVEMVDLSESIAEPILEPEAAPAPVYPLALTFVVKPRLPSGLQDNNVPIIFEPVEIARSSTPDPNPKPLVPIKFPSPRRTASSYVHDSTQELLSTSIGGTDTKMQDLAEYEADASIAAKFKESVAVSGEKME